MGPGSTPDQTPQTTVDSQMGSDTGGNVVPQIGQGAFSLSKPDNTSTSIRLQTDLEQRKGGDSTVKVSPAPLPSDEGQGSFLFDGNNQNGSLNFDRAHESSSALKAQAIADLTRGESTNASGRLSSIGKEGKVGKERSRRRWTLLANAILFYHIFAVPLRLGFFTPTSFVPLWFLWVGFEGIFIDIPSILGFLRRRKDVVEAERLRCGNGSLKSMTASTKGYKLAAALSRRTKSSYPVVDFLGSVPVVELVVTIAVWGSTSDEALAFRAWCWARLIKLVHLKHVPTFRKCVLSTLQSRFPAISQASLRCAEIILMTQLLAHCFACVWQGFARADDIWSQCETYLDAEQMRRAELEPAETASSAGWIFVETGRCRAASYMLETHGVTDTPLAETCGPCASPLHLYLRSVYWAFTTLATVGYGGITPTSAGETLFVIVVEVVAMTMYVLLLSSLTSLISNADAARLAYNRRLQLVKSYMANEEMSKSTQGKVQKYFEILWSHLSGFDDEAVLKQLPPSLQCSLKFNLFFETMADVSPFDQCPLDFLERLLVKSRISIYLNREDIFLADQLATKLVGVMSGGISLNYVNESGSDMFEYDVVVGKMVGHLECITRRKYLCSARTSAPSFTELFSIDHRDLEEVAGLYLGYDLLEDLRDRALDDIESGAWSQQYLTREHFPLENGKPIVTQNKTALRQRRNSSLSLVPRAAHALADTIRKRSVDLAPQASPRQAGPQTQTSSSNGQKTNSPRRSNAGQRNSLLMAQGPAPFAQRRSVVANGGPNPTGRAGEDINRRRRTSVIASASMHGGAHPITQARARPDAFNASEASSEASYLTSAWYMIRFMVLVSYLLLFPVRLTLLDSDEAVEISLFVGYGFDALCWVSVLGKVPHFASYLRGENRYRPFPKYEAARLAYDACLLLPLSVPFLIAGDLEMASLCRALRLFKALEFNKYYKRSIDMIERRAGRMDTAMRLALQLLFVVLVILVWMVCFWTELGKPENLLASTGVWSILDVVLKLDPDCATVTECVPGVSPAALGRSLYWAMTTITTVGYGDVKSVTAMEVAVAIVSICVVSLCLYPALIATISVLQAVPSDAGDISSSNEKETPSEVLVDRTRNCTLLADLPEEMIADIKGFTERMTANPFELHKAIKPLPVWLGKQLAYEVYGDIVKGTSCNSTPRGGDGGPNSARVAPEEAVKRQQTIGSLRFGHLFENASKELIAELCYNLQPEYGVMDRQIAYRGESATHVYFVLHGAIELVEPVMAKGLQYKTFDVTFKGRPALPERPDSTWRVKETLHKGDFCGVAEVVMGERFETNVRNSESSTLLMMPADQFLYILNNFPDDLKSIQEQLAHSAAASAAAGGAKGKRAAPRESQINKERLMFLAAKRKRFMIYPTSRTFWVIDTLTMLARLVSNLLIVLGLGAITNEYCSVESDPWILMFLAANLVADLLNVLDMVLQAWFIAATDRGQLLITDRASLCKRYLRSSRFKIDLVASFPADWIALAALGSGKLYIINWIRLIKLVRLTQMGRYVKNLENLLIDKLRVKSKNVQLIQMGLALGVFAHWIACFWVRFANSGGGLSGSWASSDCVISDSCGITGLIDSTDMKCVPYPVWRAYIRGIYWVFVTLNAVGFGDVLPTTMAETIFAVSVMFLGAAMYAVLISSLANVVANLDNTATTFKKSQESIRTYVSHRRLPQHLRDKILLFTDQMWRNQRGGSTSQVIGFLPGSMQLDALGAMDKGQLVELPLFKSLSPPILSSLTRRLYPCFYIPGDSVFHVGHPVGSLYILVHGSTAVVAEDGVTTVSKHDDKGVFGVEEFYDKSNARTSLQASTFCDMLLLDRETLTDVTKNFPGSEEIVEANFTAMKARSSVHNVAGNLKSRKVTKMMAIEADNAAEAGTGIMPSSAARFRWEIFMFAVTVYVLISVPFRIGMLADNTVYKAEGGLWAWIILDVVLVNGLGAIDMRLHARHFAFFREGSLVDTLSEIKAHYRQKWLMHDCIATIPFDLLGLAFALFATPDHALQVWAWMRLFTVWRTRRIQIYFSPLFEYYLHESNVQVSAVAVRVVQKVFFTVVAVHWIACAWYALAVYEGHANAWTHNEPGDLSMVDGQISIGFAYCRSLYWAVTTMSTVGYGDIVPNSLIETVFAITVLLCCLYLYVDLVANVTTLIANADSTTARQKTRIRAVRNMLKSRKVPRFLCTGIEEFLESSTLAARGIDENELLLSLPLSIRMEVANHLHKQALGKSSCFGVLTKSCRSEIAHALTYSCLVTGDVFATEKNVALELSLVFSGKLHMYCDPESDLLLDDADDSEGEDEDPNPGGSTLGLLPRPQAMPQGLDSLQSFVTSQRLSGEEQREKLNVELDHILGKYLGPGSITGYEMIANVPVIHTVVAVGITEMYVLSKAQFVKIMRQYPGELPALVNEAQKVVKSLEANEGFQTLKAASRK